MKPSEVIENVNGLISQRYFENPDKPKTCRTCAVGALIQALPEEKFEEIVSKLEKSNDLFGFGKFYNGKKINSIPFVRDTLIEEYGLTKEELLKIQVTNDNAERDRKAKVLKYLRSIGK